MFFTYRQNNSGGTFLEVEENGIGIFVIIEAKNAKKANKRAKSIGLYFNGVDQGLDCSCCGDRWLNASDDEGTEHPEIYGHQEQECKWAGSAFIHRFTHSFEQLKRGES